MEAYKEGYYLVLEKDILEWFEKATEDEAWTASDEAEEGQLLHITNECPEFERFKDKGLNWKEAKESERMVYFECGGSWNRGYYTLTFEQYITEAN